MQRRKYTPLFEVVTKEGHIRYQGRALYEAPPELQINQPTVEEALAFAKWPNPATYGEEADLAMDLCDRLRLRTLLGQRDVEVEIEREVKRFDPHSGDYEGVDPDECRKATIVETMELVLTNRYHEAWDVLCQSTLVPASQKDLVSRAVQVVTRDPTFAGVEKATQILRRLLSDPEDSGEDGEGDEDAEFDEESVRESMKRMLSFVERGDMHGDTRWGALEIQKPDRERALPAHMRAPKGTPRQEGYLPRAMHRFASDMAIFASKVKRPGGVSVLIDRSGSMSLSSDDIRRLMEALPASVIGGYAGQGSQGYLQVLAARGRRVQDIVLNSFDVGCGNVVDGPALEWLGGLPGPRIWVSDGAVTGIDDQMTGPNVRDCARLQKKHRIMRLNSIEEAIAYAQKRRMIRQ